MKNKTVKTLMRFSWVMLATLVMFTACKKEDPKPPAPTVEDGYYIHGEGTALSGLDFKGLMKATKNEVGQVDRNTLFEAYIAIKANKPFSISKVSGGTETLIGPASDFAEVAEEDKDNDEPRSWFARGTAAAGTSTFTVPEDGLYHVIYESVLDIAIVARVEWGIIGGATPDGWSSSTPLPSSSFNLEAMNFTGTDIVMGNGDFKFRYSDGWKIIIDGEDVRVNTNYGGALTELVPGGDNIDNEAPGIYTIKMAWTLGEDYVATFTKTGDYVPPEYPEAMYISGEATAYGWDDPGTNKNAIMHKVAGGAGSEGLFWKICHLEAGEGFKLSAAKWGEPNLGHGGVNEFDAEGIEVTATDDDDKNWIIATSGMYMIVLDLREGVKVSIKEAAVYGMGDAFGGWDKDVAANKFVVDNTAKTITSPALPADGNIRMYTSHSWIGDWWHAEFNVFDTKIEYRNDGGDQDAVPGTAGQVITLNFDDNTGEVK